MELPAIPQFYTKKTIFITGGSGFVGKVLIEKLLRSCPDLEKIYLLMREKKGQNPEERIKAIIDVPLFESLKLQNPQSLTKIEIVKGDVKLINLGLSYEDRKKLIDEVNIVFHGAASVRFDESLTDAVLLNTRGTREIATLALKMKHLEVLVHISTTYCNCDRKVVEERLYPAHANWKQTIRIAENVDRHTLNALTAKYIHPLPNTYTFTKSLAEHVIYDMCKGKIPAVIYRPSIVVPAAFEPIPGWIDNFNGPCSLIVAAGKGVHRTTYCDPNATLDYVPVDLTVKALVIASWKQATNTDETQKLSPGFYNGAHFDTCLVTMADLVEMGKKMFLEVPVNNVIWYPKNYITKCYYSFIVNFFMCDLFLAAICDGLLKLFRRKPMVLKIQRKIFTAMMALAPFMLNEWNFVNEKCANLQNELLPCDVEHFFYKADEISAFDFFKNTSIGARKYLLKEDDDLEMLKKQLFRLWILSKMFNFFWYLALIWFIFIKIDVVAVAINKCSELFS